MILDSLVPEIHLKRTLSKLVRVVLRCCSKPLPRTSNTPILAVSTSQGLGSLAVHENTGIASISGPLSSQGLIPEANEADSTG